MKQYESKEELIATIEEKYQKYRKEFIAIPEDKKNFRIEEVDKTPAENLAYQIGWVTLLLEWEAKEKAGEHVVTPVPEYKWNNLGGLYQSFYQKYGQFPLSEQLAMLDQALSNLYAWLENLSDTELFEPGQRNWATTKAQWPIWKWVHINTVAPFTNFRTKIRKWKKLVL